MQKKSGEASLGSHAEVSIASIEKLPGETEAAGRRQKGAGSRQLLLLLHTVVKTPEAKRRLPFPGARMLRGPPRKQQAFV